MGATLVQYSFGVQRQLGGAFSPARLVNALAFPILRTSPRNAVHRRSTFAIAQYSRSSTTLLLLPAPYMAARLPHELLNALRTEANSPLSALRGRMAGSDTRSCMHESVSQGRAGHSLSSMRS